jgi:hypothetical protein
VKEEERPASLIRRDTKQAKKGTDDDDDLPSKESEYIFQ